MRSLSICGSLCETSQPTRNQVACYIILKTKFRKQSCPGQVPSQPSGMEKNADKYDAFIQSSIL